MSATAERRRERHKVYMRERYANDPEYRERHKATVRETKKRLRAKIVAAVVEAKASGCMFCPETERSCLDFHHVRGEKLYALGAWRSLSLTFAQVRAEIDKCVVVCANCHRKLHAGLLVMSDADGV